MMKMKKEHETSNDQQTQIGRRKLLANTALGATGLSAASLLAACGGSPSTTTGSGEGNFPTHPNWSFTFVNHVTTNEFFQATQYGIADACALLGCKSTWVGSENSVVSEMVDAMNAAIAAKVDGIAVALIDPTAFNEPVARALAAGIPVVAYNADAPITSGNKRLAYVGQDLTQAGVDMGNRIISLLPDGGDVVGFIATPGSLNIQPRIDGAKQAIKQSGKNINFIEIATGATINEELPAVESYYLGHKNLKGMFAVDGGSTSCVSQIVAKYSLSSTVKSGGFDLEPTTLSEIQKGNLDFTIDQQPYLQGFLPVVQLFLYKLSGGLMQPSETDTGLLFVTKDNVGPYLNTKTRFEGSSATQKVVS
jgi:simple sugar transport system substrate-binding protein